MKLYQAKNKVFTYLAKKVTNEKASKTKAKSLKILISNRKIVSNN